MTDESANLILRRLDLMRQDIKQDLKELRDDVRDLRERMDTFEKHMQGFFNEIVRHSSRFAVLEQRLDRRDDPPARQ